MVSEAVSLSPAILLVISGIPACCMGRLSSASALMMLDMPRVLDEFEMRSWSPLKLELELSVEVKVSALLVVSGSGVSIVAM